MAFDNRRLTGKGGGRKALTRGLWGAAGAVGGPVRDCTGGVRLRVGHSTGSREGVAQRRAAHPLRSAVHHEVGLRDGGRRCSAAQGLLPALAVSGPG